MNELTGRFHGIGNKAGYNSCLIDSAKAWKESLENRLSKQLCSIMNTGGDLPHEEFWILM